MPLFTSVPSGHVPNAVMVKVCVNIASTSIVPSPTIWRERTCVTVGDWVGANAKARERKERRRRKIYRILLRSITVLGGRRI